MSAKKIMGGRDDYRRRQDEFYEQVGKPRGVERGEVHDPENIRKHLTVQEFKKQTFELETERLIEQNKELRKECQALLIKNQNLQDINAALLCFFGNAIDNTSAYRYNDDGRKD